MATQTEKPQPIEAEDQTLSEEAKKRLRQPRCIIKIARLKPGTSGHNIIAKVINIREVTKDKENAKNRVAECLIGDETGCILLTARNEQIDLLKEGECIVIRNAKITLFKSTMRLSVDKWGLLQTFEEGKKNITVPISSDFEPNAENNVSKQQYRVVYEEQ